MRTNLVQTFKVSANRFNLNRTAMRVALIGLFISLGVGSAWADHSKHYGKAVLQNATGHGTVYLSTSSTENKGQTSSSSPGSMDGTSWITWNCGESSDKDKKTYYARYSAVSDGYYWAGWATGSSATSYKASTEGKEFSASSTTESSPTTATIYGYFLPVEVNSVTTPSPSSFSPTNCSTSCLDYTGTVVFTTDKADAIADFTASVTDKSGSGVYTLASAYTAADQKVTVTYTFTGNNTYGGTSRSNSATITLASKGGENSLKSSAITATFPNAKIVSDGETEEIYAIYKSTDETQAGEDRTAVFDVEYVDGIDNFDTPTITGADASKFTYNSMSYAAGKLTVNYTYYGNKTAGDHTATLTLKINDAIGGTDATYGAKSVTLIAHNEQESDYDAKIEKANGDLVYQGDWATALSKQADGYKLTLLRNVDLGTLAAGQSITKNLTIDLNGKTLSATVSATISYVLYMNATGKTLTIEDSKTGGRIAGTGSRNNALYGVFINKGNVKLNSGTIEIVNTNTSTTTADRLYATGVYVKEGTTFEMNGGKVIGRRAARDAYGIYVNATATARGVVTINSGEVYSYGNTYSYGIRGYGTVNINGGKVHAETLTGAYAYAVALRASANATASSGFYGILNMTDGTLEAVTKTSNAYAAFADRSCAGTGAALAVDGTHTNKETGQITITGGTLKATPTTSKGYGVLVYGGYSSKDNKTIKTVIENATVEVSATEYAYGVMPYSEVNATYGACFAAEAELTNCTISATTRTKATAYAVYCTSAQNTVYEADQPLYAGEYATAAKVTINSGTYTATTKTTTAIAVCASRRAKSVFSPTVKTATERVRGEGVEAYPIVIIHGGTFSATAGTYTSRAVSTGGYTTIDGGTFSAYSTTTTSYALYCNAGKITASGVNITASATGTVAAAFADGNITSGNEAQCGWTCAGELELNNCNLTATARTGATAYGVRATGTSKMFTEAALKTDSASNGWSTTNYNAYYAVMPKVSEPEKNSRAVCGKATINGGTITATAATTDANAVSLVQTIVSSDGDKVAVGEVTVKNATLSATTNSAENAYGVYAGGKSNIDNCTITATSATSGAYGVIAYDDTSTITKCNITATTTTTGAYGISASGVVASNGVRREAVMTVDGCTVNSTSGTNNSYALYATGTTGGAWSNAYYTGSMAVAGKITVNGGTYHGHANGSGGYGAVCAAVQVKNDAVAYPSIIINDGKFRGSSSETFADVSANGEPGYFVLNGGYYVTDLNIDKKLGDGMNKVGVKSGTPEYTEGYRYHVTADMTGEIVCKVYKGTTLQSSFQSLEEALQYVNTNASSSNQLVIVMCANYTLSKGDYLLPKYSTLLLPYLSSGTGKGAVQPIGTSPALQNQDAVGYVSPTPLYKLTFASGVNMTVLGAIEVSAVTFITNGGEGANGVKAGLTSVGTGVVSGTYGWLQLDENSHIDLESGATISAWGYITGKGEINAKSGSTIYEDFQMGDWRGGSEEIDVNGNQYGLNRKGVFLITHYYYQNIECAVTYRPGAFAKAYGGTYMNYVGNVATNAVNMVGTTDDSMFHMDEGASGESTWVRKEYDPDTDYMNWTLNSGASIGSISLQMDLGSFGDIDLNSSDYVLPITSNFNIIANYGEVEISNDVCFLPGSRLTIKKEATIIIPSGQRVFFYDQDDWLSFAAYWFYPGYSPSWKTNPRTISIGDKTKQKMPDAEVLIEGIFDIRGAAYTTAGGANIHSTRENAGKVKFTATAPASTAATGETTGYTTLYQWKEKGPKYDGKALNSVWLKNEDGNYSQTTGTAANKTWIYMEDDDHVYRWILSYEDGCFTYKNNGGGGKQLIHPSDWVAVVANTNGDHAYHSEDGTRMFVNAKAAATNANCVWWEVDPTPVEISGTTYYVANNEYFDNYGTYFYWDNGTSYWKPKKVTVTWKNWDGSTLTNGSFGNEYNFNTSPEYFGSNPTKTNTAIEHYDWIGWRDPEGNIYDKNATLPRATENIIYTAYFDAAKYQYTITFKNKDDNKVIWAGLMDAGSIPVCPVEPQQDPTVDRVYTFTNWEGYAANADLPTVTAPATYTALYSYTTRQYTVTFYNFDNVEVLQSSLVDYGTAPSYTGITPYRANSPIFSYAWTGWQQGANTYGTSPTFPNVTGDIFYVATFSQTELQYQVFFKRPDGSVIDAGFYAYNGTPSSFPADPTMESSVSTDYTFSGWSPATLQPVTEDGMVYTALFDESVRQYTAHFVNYDGATLNADQTIDYNTVPTYTGATPFKPNDTRNSYEFAGWAWEGGTAGIGDALPALMCDITFTAQFNPTLLQFNVIYQRPDGTFIKQDKVKWGQTTTAPSAAECNYQDAQYTYTFNAWSPATIVNPVTTDATYTAVYNTPTPRSYSVTLNTNGGTINAGNVTSYTYGTGATLPTNVSRTGYDFSGWYDNSGLAGSAVTNISASATGDKAYWAKWTVHTHALAWDFAGGSTSSTTHTPANNALAYGSAINYPANNTMTKTGYTFGSWSSSATTMPDNDLTITASWNVVTYNLTYDGLEGATNSNPATYTIETPTIMLADPGTRADYNFTGWTCGGSPITQITLGSTGDKVITANWEQIGVTILWKSEDGGTTLETDEGVGIGATPSFDGTTPTKATTEAYTYTFDGWSTTIGGDVLDPLPTVSAAATYYAHFAATANVASVKVGSAEPTYYTDFAEAWDATNSATGAVTLKLLQNVSGIATSMAYTNAQNCTLDLNNHTLSGTITKLINVNASGKTFTIDDNSDDKGGKIKTEQSLNGKLYGLFITAGKVNLNAGTIECINTKQYNSSSAASVAAYGVYVYSSSARYFTMTGGTVKANATYNVFGVYSAGTTKLEGGNVIVSDVVTGLTKSGTGYGVYVAGATTTISKSADISVNTKTVAYGVYVNAGTANATGGVILAKTSSSKTAYGVYAYAGTFNAPEGSTTSVTANAYTTTASAIVTGASGTANIYAGTYEAKAPTSTGTTTYGIYSSGTTNIHGGTFTISAKTSTARAIAVWRNTTTVDGNPVFNVSAPTIVYGATAAGSTPKASTAGFGGTLKVYGGTFNIEATKTTTAYGVYAYAGTGFSMTTEGGTIAKGNYINAGTVEVHGGTFNVKAKTTDAYGVFVNNGTQTNAEAGEPKTAYGKCTITDGQFKVETTGDANATAYAMNTVATEENLTVQGGWYNTKRTDASTTSVIEDKYTAPEKSCNYWVLPLSDATYHYEVAEAYNITFKDGDNNTIQEGPVKKDVTPAYTGATPTKTEDANYTYTFNNSWEPAIVPATAAATYTAQFTGTPKSQTYYYIDPATGEITYVSSASTPENPADYDDEDYTYGFSSWTDNGDGTYTASYSPKAERTYGTPLDIVDWTADAIVVNANGLKAAEGGTTWEIKYNGDYVYNKNTRTTDRRLLIDRNSEDADTYIVLKLKGTGGVERRNKYLVPHIYDASATLTGTKKTSVVYVHTGATLTVSESTKIADLYVSPDANVIVANGATLTITGKLVLRTLPWQSAAIEGNVDAAQTFYTRIAPNGLEIDARNGKTTYTSSPYYQLALPYECNIADVRLSDGSTPEYNKTWLLKSYSESSRATKGATENNWVAVSNTGTDTKIKANTGYEFYSNSTYYREYYFPVTPTGNNTVKVARSDGDNTNAGWNMICSPLMSNHQKNPHPEDITVSWLNEEGKYDQSMPDVIPPAIPFFYQAAVDNEEISFAGTNVTPSLAPRRRIAAADEPTRIQWIRLDVKDANGEGDETNIYSHPTRYEQYYQTGIDVAKQSLTATRARLYSSHTYGDMAFAGVSDELFEQGVALTVYSPAAQELTFSLRRNDWLNRLDYVWIVDTETGAMIDLLSSDYTAQVTEGTTYGRFYISGRFHKPGIATDIEPTSDSSLKGRAQKVLIEEKIYIMVGDKLYDATGKLVKGK